MIYYSHVNEDSRIERALLRQSGCAAAVAVAGSGERLLALLDVEGCREFHAVDVHDEPLFLLQLKLAALGQLSVEEYRRFCGFHPARPAWRLEQYEKIKDALPLSSLLYWQDHKKWIEKGLLHTGHFERFLQRVRPFVRFFLGKNFPPVLLNHSVPDKTFPHKRWKLLLRLFALPVVYWAGGNRDPAFTGKGAAVSLIPAALDGIICNGRAAACFMTHLIFTGHLQGMEPETLPPSLQKEVLQRVQQRLRSSVIQIHFHHCDLLQFVEKQVHARGEPVFYSCSDILSFETPAYVEELLDKTSGPGNTVVWRSFLRNRAGASVKQQLNRKYGSFREHTSEESTGMYQVFSITVTPENNLP